MRMSDTIAELAKALSAAQAELPDAVASSKNPHFKSKYANLASVRETVNSVLPTHGLAYVQCCGNGDGFVTVETILMHSSGQWIADNLTLPVVKRDPQGYGSAITYARRYGLMAILGLSAADDDDDGNEASKPAATKPARSVPDMVPDYAPYDDEPIGPEPTITPDQAEQIMSMIAETGSDSVRFMALYGIKRLSDMPAVKFADAIGKLKRKAQSMATADA